METIITFAIAAVIGGGVAGYFTLTTERRKNYVERLPDSKIRVDFRSLKRERGMWIIPDYGILNIEVKQREEAE